MKSKNLILIPDDKDFIESKDISDRIYAWMSLNSYKRDGKLYITKGIHMCYEEIGINYRTFIKGRSVLEGAGYIKDVGNEYEIDHSFVQYKRYIYKDTLECLLSERKSNLIKLYIELCSLYETVRKKGNEPFFVYSNLVQRLGYNQSKDMRNKSKIKELVEKLSELGLIEYEEKSVKYGDGHINKVCIIKWISRKIEGGEKI